MGSEARRSLNGYMNKAADHNAESIRRRHVKVEWQITNRGISSPCVLDVTGSMECEIFCQKSYTNCLRSNTVADQTGQTITQTYCWWFTPPAPARRRWRQRRPLSWGW